MLTVMNFAPPPFRAKEALRYAGHKTKDLPPAVRTLMEDCLAEAEGSLSFSVCYDRVAAVRQNGVLRIGDLETASKAVAAALRGCDEVLLFAATVGAGMDRLTRRYERLSPARALMLQGIGAERVESLCDLFCAAFGERLAAEGKALLPRVSPGYGDIPMEMQRDFFRALDLTRRLGVTLGDDLLMTPTKSVTALAGIVEEAK